MMTRLLARYSKDLFTSGKSRHLLAVLLAVFLPGVVWQGLGPTGLKADDTVAQLHRHTVERGIRYLRTQGQAEDGAYSAGSGPGVTALVTTAVLRNGYLPQDPLVQRSLKYLRGFVQKDGGIYAPGSMYRNYETSLAVMCFSEANRQQPETYKKLIQNADHFLKGMQYDDGEGHDRSSKFYGGSGYGRHKRPDLSNTGIMIDALVAAGATPDDEAIRKALIFVSRCQNLETEHNDTKWSVKNPDGGFYYTGAAGGSSQAKWEAGKGEEVHGLRSYGSMTYMGLKSMIYAGLSADDPRVKAATGWIRKNYRLDENPGLGKQGLYYYYHTFAKALDALGIESFVDDKGSKHDWRRELTEKLASEQQPNGSWINTHSRWLEADPNLVTGYALLALSYCQQK
jgi:squalene-hopene/tetraprenyl-beta-curcumene cyclase